MIVSEHDSVYKITILYPTGRRIGEEACPEGLLDHAIAASSRKWDAVMDMSDCPEDGAPKIVLACHAALATAGKQLVLASPSLRFMTALQIENSQHEIVHFPNVQSARDALRSGLPQSRTLRILEDFEGGKPN